MIWTITLGNEPAISWPHGDTALQAAASFVEANFPEHLHKQMIAKDKGDVAEMRFEDVHIRVERAVRRAA